MNDAALLERLAAERAQLVLGAKMCAAYARGDRRGRPLFYVERTQAVRLLECGQLQSGEGKVLCLPPSVRPPQYVPPKRQPRAPLEALRKSRAGRAPYLTARDVRAGERYAYDYMRAHQGRAAGQHYDAAGVFTAKSSAGQEAAMAARIDAEARLRAARKYTGPNLARLLNAVLGQDIPLGTFETQLGWTRGSAKPVFKKALSELAAHYAEIK